jgi:hypothetical protein
MQVALQSMAFVELACSASSAPRAAFSTPVCASLTARRVEQQQQRSAGDGPHALRPPTSASSCAGAMPRQAAGMWSWLRGGACTWHRMIGRCALLDIGELHVLCTSVMFKAEYSGMDCRIILLG